MKKDHLLFFCNYRPSSSFNESVFISNELKFLKDNFSSLNIIPTMDLLNDYKPEEGIILGYSAKRKKKILSKIFCYFFYSFTSVYFYKEILSNFNILLNIDKLARLIIFLGIAKGFNKWLKNYLKCNNVSVDSLILYTYWFCPITFGCALLKKHYPNITVISRAHGFDLYAERQKIAYKPCRSFLFSLIDKVYTVSDDGKYYLECNYPKYSYKIETARLGTSLPDFSCKISTDGIFRVVSCSSIIPVKRVPLLAKVLCKVAEKNIDRKIIWTHIGDGIEREKVMIETQSFPSNLHCKFHGNISNEEVFSFYKNNPVDVFINVSCYEGIPVSIMEAQSCGIPVVASSVGGIPEIVNNNNGFLVPYESKVKTISEIIITFMQLPVDELEKKRFFSKKIHFEKNNAEKNFLNFITSLKKFND